MFHVPPEALTCPAAFGQRGAAVRAWCAAQRSHWHARHVAGASAEEVGHGLAEAMAAVLRALFDRAQSDLAASPAGAPEAVLGGMGSLGRRELAPFSDLDVMVLAQRRDDPRVQALADAVFYPLWDARLEVGHAVRTPQEFALLAQEDDTVRTTAVDFVALAGSDAVATDLQRRLQAALRSQVTRRYALAAVRAWASGSNAGTIYKLQPDIKSGPGGLREIHRLWWLGRLLFRIESWHDLLTLGLIDASDFAALAAGRAALFDMRLALHFTAQRRQDQLRFDLQDEVAAALHVPPGPAARTPADNLLQVFYRHAKAVRAVSSHVLARFAERLEPPRPRQVAVALEGFDVFDRQLTLQHVDQFIRTPRDMLRILRVAQRHGLLLRAHARGKLREAAPQGVDAALRADPEARRLFVQILADPSCGGATLEDLHDTGILERFVPEFGPVTGLAQRDLYHVHTVDAHLVACARLAQRMLGGFAQNLTEDQVHATQTPVTPDDLLAMAGRVSRPLVFTLAALLHDIGKGHGHGHAERGAAMAEVTCTRLGLAAEDAQDIVWLVLEHLTLFRVSQRRNLEDTALIAELARNVGSVERLELLMLLSYADAQTTGPEAWNTWKHQLLRELCDRIRDVLDHGVGAATLAARAAMRLEAARGMAPAPWALAGVATRLPARHLAAHRPVLLLCHMQALLAAETAGPQVVVREDGERQACEIVVVGVDRPGLLVDLSGVLAAWGIPVEAAYISTTADHWAVDTFVVRSGHPALLSPMRQGRVVDELRQAMHTAPAVADRLAERRRAAAIGRPYTPRAPTRVVFDLDAIDGATVVDVFAADRGALLYDLTCALFAAGVSIVLARITTEGDRAIDAFYLVGAHSHARLELVERLAVQSAIERATAGDGGAHNFAID